MGLHVPRSVRRTHSFILFWIWEVSCALSWESRIYHSSPWYPPPQPSEVNEAPTYEPSSCELSKMRICYYPDLSGSFFHRVDTIESSKEPEPVPSTSGVSEIAACLPSPVADSLSSPTSHLPFLLRSVSLLSCSPDASPWIPAVVLYYYTFQATVL